MVLHWDRMVGSSSAGRWVIDAQRHAVFAAFLGDARNGPLGRLEAQRLVDRNVAMGFFADEGDGNAAGAPHAEIEGEAGQHRDHDIDDFGGQAAQFDEWRWACR